MKNSFFDLKHSLGLILLTGALAGFQACSSDGKKESRTEDAMEQTGDAMSADAKDAQAAAKDKIREADEKITNKAQDAGEQFRHDRDVVVANIKARTKEIDAKIDELQAKAKRSGNEAKADTKDQIEKLKDERDGLNDDLKKAQSATADAWQDVKKGFKRAGNEIGDAFDRAGEKLKNK